MPRVRYPGGPATLETRCVVGPFAVEVEVEEDGRFLAEIAALPGCLAYGITRDEAVRRVEALALRVIADRLDHDEPAPDVSALFAA